MEIILQLVFRDLNALQGHLIPFVKSMLFIKYVNKVGILSGKFKSLFSLYREFRCSQCRVEYCPGNWSLLQAFASIFCLKKLSYITLWFSTFCLLIWGSQNMFQIITKNADEKNGGDWMRTADNRDIWREFFLCLLAYVC